MLTLLTTLLIYIILQTNTTHYSYLGFLYFSPFLHHGFIQKCMSSKEYKEEGSAKKGSNEVPEAPEASAWWTWAAAGPAFPADC